MNLEITMEKADSIVIDFLSKNGFGDNIRIERTYNGDEIRTDVWDEIFYKGQMVKRITPITNFNKLLKEILNYMGNDACYVASNMTRKGLSFVISAGYNNSRGR